MPKTTQIVISVESRPGILAKVASVLGSAGVNIKAFSAPAVTRSGKGQLRLIVDHLEQARSVFKAEKIKFREEPALVLSLENKPGALSEVAQHLKQAKINIECAYLTPSREGRRAIVVMTLSNMEKALTVLRDQSLDEI